MEVLQSLIPKDVALSDLSGDILEDPTYKAIFILVDLELAQCKKKKSLFPFRILSETEAVDNNWSKETNQKM